MPRERGNPYRRPPDLRADGMAVCDGARHHRIPLVGGVGYGVDVCCRNLFSAFDAVISGEDFEEAPRIASGTARSHLVPLRRHRLAHQTARNPPVRSRAAES